MTTRRAAPGILLLAPVLAVACAQSPAQMEQALVRDSLALIDVLTRADAALSAQNADDYSALLTSDAVLMPPGQPPVVGAEAIGDWNRSQFAQVTVNVASEPLEQVIAEDWAFQRGTTRIRIAPRGDTAGQAFEQPGKFVRIYRREGDGWKLARAIWSTNTPAASQ